MGPSSRRPPMQHARPDFQQHIQDNRSPEEGGLPPDLPVFLIVGWDAAAAATVRCRAFKALQLGADPRDVAQALAQADAIDAWPVHKNPDAPKP